MSQEKVLKKMFDLYRQDSNRYFSVSELVLMLETECSERSVRHSVKKLFKSELLELDFRNFLSRFISGKHAVATYRLNGRHLKKVGVLVGDFQMQNSKEVSEFPVKNKSNIRNKVSGKGEESDLRGVLYEL